MPRFACATEEKNNWEVIYFSHWIGLSTESGRVCVVSVDRYGKGKSFK